MTTRSWTLLVACAATAMLMLDIAVVNTALASIAADLDTGLQGLQWVVDAYTLTLATTVLTAGALADRLGRRRVFAFGLGVFTVSSLACALAGDIVALNVARAVQGIGGAILFATSLALLANAFPGARERAGALAVYGATIGGSFAIGPLVGGLLTSGLDWRWVFLINVPLGIVLLTITVLRVAESRDPAGRPIDWPGQITLAGGVSLLVAGLLRGNEDGWGSLPIVAALSAAVALLVAFVVVEARSRAPMVPLALFRTRAFTGAQLGAFAISASFFAVFLYSTLYLQSVLGLSPIEAGLAYLPGTVIMVIVSGATANLSERIPPGVLVAVGLLLVGAGMGMMTVAEVGSSWTAILPGSIVALIGTGLFNPAVTAVALGSVPGDQGGLAAGVNDTFRQAGIALGVAALGALIPAEGILTGGNPAAYVDGLQNALWAGAALAVAGALAAAALIRTPATGTATAPAAGELAIEPA